MEKPKAPAAPEPGNALQNDDWQRRHLEDVRNLHAECERIGAHAIRVKLVRGEWTGFQKIVADEWLVYYDAKSAWRNGALSIIGVVAAVLAAIFGAMTVF